MVTATVPSTRAWEEGIGWYYVIHIISCRSLLIVSRDYEVSIDYSTRRVLKMLLTTGKKNRQRRSELTGMQGPRRSKESLMLNYHEV